MTKLLDYCTRAMAALLILGPPVAFFAMEPRRGDVVEFSLVTLAGMTMLNLGLLLAPLVAARHWLLRLPVVALMLPAMAMFLVFACLSAGEAAVLGRQHDFPVWIVAPLLFTLCIYVATLARLVAVGTPLAHLIRPTPREDTPTGWSRVAASAGWR